MSQDSIGARIVAPVQVATGSPAGSSLENLNTSILADGSYCYVTSGIGAGPWLLRKIGTGTPDGVTVVQPMSGPGLWYRMPVGSAVLMPTFSDIYVDPINGNDQSSGHLNTPVRTMGEVGSRLGGFIPRDVDVTVHFLNPHPDPDGFPIEEICKPRFVAGALRWRSELQTVVSGVLTLTNRSGSLYTFTGAGPWTVDEWVGYGLSLVSSSVPGQQVGSTKHISHNTADTITLCFTHDAYPGFGGPAIGDTFQIVHAAVAFNLSPYADGTTPYLYGGTSTALNVAETRPRNGIVQLRNIDFRVPDGVSDFTWYASGGLDFVGWETSTDGTTRPFLVSEVSGITAGQWIAAAYNPGEYVYGWGFASRPRVAGGNQTRFWMGKTLSDMYLVTECTIVSEGSWMYHQAGSFRASSAGGGNSTQALWVEGGGIYRQHTDNTSYRRIFRTTAVGQRDVFVTNSGNAYLQSLTHVGLGAIFWCEREGYLFKSGTNTIEGSTAPSSSGFESWANRGGKVELVGDQANLGDVTVGSNGATYNTRANAPWAVNDRLIPLSPTFGEVVMRLS